MNEPGTRNVWDVGAAYEPYVGRWSRLVAQEFLRWLNIPPSRRWLDVGCGTGALTEMIVMHAEPAEVDAVDPSEGYLEVARQRVADPRVRFEVADARRLPMNSASYDAIVSGLVLNFVTDVHLGVAEMVRVTRPEGTISAYVWDYAGKMELMRYFWDAAVALHPKARELDEGRRFPLCQPERLRTLFEDAGLHNVEVRAIDVPTYFRDFDDYWLPFLGGQFPAPDYAVSLSEDDRTALRERLRTTLPVSQDGSISLTARAWAVRGTR